MVSIRKVAQAVIRKTCDYPKLAGIAIRVHALEPELDRRSYKNAIKVLIAW